MWTWIIVIVVLVLIAFMIWGRDDSNTATDTAANGNTDTSVNGGTSGTNGSNAGSNSGSVSNDGSNSGANGLPAIPSDATLMALFNVSRVRVPQSGSDVALSAGQGSYTNGTTKGQVMLGSILAKVTTTDGYDVFVNMTLTKTAANTTSTTENYVALFHVKSGVATYTSAVLVGAGLPVRSVEAKRDPAVTSAGTPVSPYMDSVKGYLLTVSYLDRKNGEPTTATPTAPKDFTAHVKAHVISK